MPRPQKGQAQPNTIVVKILELRADWIAKVPKVADRDEALRKVNSDWKKFQNFCGASHIINNRCNMSMDMYFKFIEAAGLDYDTYWDSAANPNDYISKAAPSVANKDKKSTFTDTEVKKKKPEKVYVNVTKSNVVEPVDKKITDISASDLKVLPDYIPVQKETPAEPAKPTPTVVQLEKPIRSSVANRLSNSSKPTPTVVRTVKYDENKKIDHSSAYSTMNSFDQKMNSFRIHLSVYMCALHIGTDHVIADTDIHYFRDIRDGKADLKLFEYIVLSEYLMKKYNVCTNSEYKSTFRQIAALFNDIYVQTLYFNDANSANAIN